MIDAGRFERALVAFVAAHMELLASVGESEETAEAFARSFLESMRARLEGLRGEGRTIN